MCVCYSANAINSNKADTINIVKESPYGNNVIYKL